MITANIASTDITNFMSTIYFFSKCMNEYYVLKTIKSLQVALFEC